MDTKEEAVTKPTLGTILERINSLGDQINTLREEMELRLDRIESMTNQTRAEMLTLRADFREFRTQLKESIA